MDKSCKNCGAKNVDKCDLCFNCYAEYQELKAIIANSTKPQENK